MSAPPPAGEYAGRWPEAGGSFRTDLESILRWVADVHARAREVRAATRNSRHVAVLRRALRQKLH